MSVAVKRFIVVTTTGFIIMVYTEAELKAKTVKDLKEIAKELGAAATGKKDELVAAILAVSADPAAADDAGLEDELEEPAAEEAAAPAAGADAAAASGKHASIVFALEGKKVEEKKANIVGVKALSDAERAQLRAAKFGIKPAAGSAAAKPDAKAAGGGKAADKTLEEQVKVLERGIKYGTCSEADKAKLEKLRKQLEAQKEKQRLALDKVELTDPDKMAAREKKFGKPLTAGKDPKDPELLKKRAAKFGKPIAAPASAADDDARKKARLERFAKEK